MKRHNPKVGEVWVAVNDTDPELCWYYQIVAVFDLNGNRFFSAVKEQWEWDGTVWTLTFGENWVDSLDGTFRLAHKTRRKPFAQLIE